MASSKPKQAPLTALIDGDILVYQAAVMAEKEHRWDDGIWTYHADETEGEYKFLAMLEELVKRVGATDFIIALSEPVAALNWRLGILPTYKSNRKTTRRPLIRKHLNEWAMSNFRDRVYLRPGLEGDDVLGILATHPTLIAGDKIVVSIDKDFKTIPGRHYNQGKDLFFEVNEEEADWWHIHQAITGDTTDGYAGCPGAGPTVADEICNEPYLSVPYTHTITRGKRKGETETRYKKEPTDDRWAAVVSLYESKGLTEADALIQARVARICRHTDYDFKQKKVIPWTPTNTK